MLVAGTDFQSYGWPSTTNFGDFRATSATYVKLPEDGKAAV